MVLAYELLQDVVDDVTAQRGIRRRDQRVQRIKPKHLFRVDCIWIADQRLDLRDGQFFGPSLDRRAGRRAGRRSAARFLGRADGFGGFDPLRPALSHRL